MKGGGHRRRGEGVGGRDVVSTVRKKNPTFSFIFIIAQVVQIIISSSLILVQLHAEKLNVVCKFKQAVWSNMV